jgi:hypothetical protein
MNNTELFIKYLDDSFSIKEKQNFEKRLSNETELKKEFERFSKTFNSLNKNLEVDERYFSTILPNARRRIEAKEKLPKQFLPILKLNYAIPMFLIAAFLVYRIFIYSPQTLNQLNFDAILSELDSNRNAAVELFNETLHSNDYQYDQNIYSAVYDENDYNKLLFNYAEANKNTIEINDSLINQLNENEFNLVYNEIINKKIL